MMTRKFKDSINIFKFNMTSIYKRKSILIYIALFFVLTFMTFGVILPFRLAGGVALMSYLVVPLFVILGYLGYNMRKSTVYKNISSNGLSRSSFYLGQLISVLLIGNIITLCFYSILFALSPFAIWSSNWGATQSPPIQVNPFYNGAWINIIYITQVTILLTFSVYLLIQSICDNERAYYITVAGIYMLGIIFGGTINNYFLLPDWLPIVNGDYLEPGIEEVTLTEEEFELLVFDTYFDRGSLGISFNLFPENIFIPTLLYPFFGVGQFTTTAIFEYTTMHEYHTVDAVINVVGESGDISFTTTLRQMSGIDEIRTWNYFSLSLSKDTWQWTMVILQPYIWTLSSLFIADQINKARR